MKKIILWLSVVLLLQIVWAEGSFIVSPETIEQNNILTITIYPGGEGFNEFGYILDENKNVENLFNFRCDEEDGEEDDKCFSQKSAEIFIDDSYLGEYFVYVFDYSLYDKKGDYITQEFRVIESGEDVNGVEDDDGDEGIVSEDVNGNEGIEDVEDVEEGGGGMTDEDIVVEDESGQQEGIENNGEEEKLNLLMIIVVLVIIAIIVFVIFLIWKKKSKKNLKKLKGKLK